MHKVIRSVYLKFWILLIFINVTRAALSRQNITLTSILIYIIVKEDGMVMIVQVVSCIVFWRPLIEIFVTISCYINIWLVKQYLGDTFLICRYLRCRILLMYSFIRLRFLLDGILRTHLVRVYSINILTIFLNNFELA